MKLIISSPDKESLEKKINEFYFSENYFINDEMQAENKKTGKKLGKVKATKKRWQYHN